MSCTPMPGMDMLTLDKDVPNAKFMEQKKVGPILHPSSNRAHAMKVYQVRPNRSCLALIRSSDAG